MSQLLPWKKRLWRDFQQAARYSAALEKWRDQDTAEVQLRKLQVVWADATADVPYYRNLVQCGKAPAAIRSWDKFRAIPELDRPTFQEHADEFRRLSGPPDLLRSTGGTTGAPIQFGVWKAEDETLRMLKLVLWLRMGYTPEDRIFLIWGHAHLLGTGWRRLWNHALRKSKDRLAGYRRADAYALDPAKCRRIAEDLIAFRPAGLIGYASALDYFVRVTPEFHGRFGGSGLRFVLPSAEPAPKPDSFALLRKTFRCAVVQEFGGVDFGQVGMRVDEEPFLVFPDHNILEAASVSNERRGYEAAVVTPLYHRYTPLIRYRQGDLLGSVERQAHGHVRAFQSLSGRINDMVELPGGRRIHSVAFLHCVHQEPAVLNAQLILFDTGPSLRLVSTAGYDRECEERIRHRLGQLAVELAGIQIEIVRDVETTVAGKRRWFVDKRSRS